MLCGVGLERYLLFFEAVFPLLDFAAAVDLALGLWVDVEWVKLFAVEELFFVVCVVLCVGAWLAPQIGNAAANTMPHTATE